MEGQAPKQKVAGNRLGNATWGPLDFGAITYGGFLGNCSSWRPISLSEQLLAVRDLSDAIAPWFSEGAMDNWQSTFFGLKRLPRELTAFEIEAFFTFTRAERQLIEDRRRAELMLGLALQIGFLRTSGRLLDA
jgi:hypothetical protein